MARAGRGRPGRSGRPRELPRKAGGEGRAVACARRRATGFPLDDLAFVVAHFLPHPGRDDVHRILRAEGPSRRPAPTEPESATGKLEECELGFAHVDAKHLPEPRTADGEPRERFLFVAVDRRSRSVRLTAEDEETEAAAEAFLEEAPAAFPFRVTRVPTDRGGWLTAEGFEGRCREPGVGHRETRPCTPPTNGTAGRVDGRVRREVPGITVAGHRDLERRRASARPTTPAAGASRSGARRRARP